MSNRVFQKDRKERIKKEHERIGKEYDYLRICAKENLIECFLWEFLRRNPKYRNAYKKYQKNKKYYDGSDSRDEVLDYFGDCGHELHDFRRYSTLVYPFGLKEILDPDLRADAEIFKEKPIRSYFRWPVKLYHYRDSCVLLDCKQDKYSRIKTMAAFSGLTEWTKVHPHTIDIRIDVTSSFEKTMIDIKRLIDAVSEVVLSEVKSKTETAQHLKTERIRWEEWCLYIIAYDLKKAGHSIEGVGDIIFCDPESKKDVSQRKIMRYISNGRKFIDKEGYKRYFLISPP